MCKHKKYRFCVLVTVEPAGLIIPSQMWGISTGFHVIPKQDARFWSSRQAVGELRELCTGMTQAQISPHAHATALQVSRVSAKPPRLRKMTNSRWRSCYVRSTNGCLFHCKIITSLFVFLKIFIKLIKLYFIHRQMMCHTFWKTMLENCVVSFKGHATAAGSAYSLAIHSAFIYNVKIILPPCRKL